MNVEHFYCYGCIGEADPLFKIFTGADDPIVSASKVSEFLSSLSKDVTEVIVHINSRGGSVDEGFAIHDLFKTSGKKITTRVEGKAASIASVILFAGSVRQITENSKVMIHNPWIDPFSMSGFEADELQTLADQMKAEESRILEFYVKNTDGDREAIASMMKEETEFDAGKALELKFATEILEPKKAKAYAFLKINHQTQNTMSKELKTLGQKLDSKLDAMFKAFADLKAGVTNTLTIKSEEEIKAESFKTSEGATINIDGGLAVGSPVTDEAGAPMVDASITLEDGTAITTDASGNIATVTEKQADPAQEAIDAAVASATKALQKENETLKAQIAESIKAQEKTNARIDLLAKEIQSDFNVKTGDTKFTTQARSTNKKDGLSSDDITARKKEIEEARKAKSN